MRAVLERGRIGIFNRSYYEDVLVVRVHPEMLEKQKLPQGRRDRRFWEHRYADINAFERHLVRNGTLILKFFLHLSKKEQKRRFVQRLQDSHKHWKFSFGDLAEREHWDAYQAAFTEMLRQTSTREAPWWVIPAGCSRARGGSLAWRSNGRKPGHTSRPSGPCIRPPGASPAPPPHG